MKIIPWILLPILSQALVNEYLPGSVAPPGGWFPLRNVRLERGKKAADSLLTAFLKAGIVVKNKVENHLEGETRLPRELVETFCDSRVGEQGEVFLDGRGLGKVALAGYNLNWADFYGGLIETEYLPSARFKLKTLRPEALLVIGPKAQRVAGAPLKPATENEKGMIENYLLSLDPPLFEFVSQVEADAYRYPAGGKRFLVVANFVATRGFTPGALLMMEQGVAGGFEVIAQYYIGESSKFIQSLAEEGDPHPVVEVGTFGSGTEYIVLQFNGSQFNSVYKKQAGGFP